MAVSLTRLNPPMAACATSRESPHRRSPALPPRIAYKSAIISRLLRNRKIERRLWTESRWLPALVSGERPTLRGEERNPARATALAHSPKAPQLPGRNDT